MRIRPIALVTSVLLSAAALVGAGAAPASAATLFQCNPYGTSYSYACTRVTDAPSTGVAVKDRASGRIYQLHNGDSVVLLGVGYDKFGRCGVYGDPWVWRIGWVGPTGYRHHAMIGDYYLATGSWSNWSNYRDSWGELGNATHRMYRVSNGGHCDTIDFWDDGTYPQ